MQDVRVLSEERLNRIRWRCRRGLLENDLVLTRFLAGSAARMTEDDVVMLDRLLDLTDNDLWDLIAGRTEPLDPRVAPLLAQLRGA
ncbi:MAG: succinate dehydrogenase assembly factor 2 [Burkholderiales bacterium]|nr:succinate dehydrogenase assembly factor 2 [Burkholderiales bacterium]